MFVRGILPALACTLLFASAHAVTVKLTEADGARVNVSLHPGDVLRVELPSEPAGGKRWSLQGHKPDNLLELGATDRVFGGRMSNQGISSFAWRALNAGNAEITLADGTASFRDQKTGEQRPDKTYVIHIAIAGDPLGPEEGQSAALSHLERFAEYERTGPCGDCSALAEHLTLYRAPDESPYVLRRTYQDAPGGTLTSVMTGRWSIHQGSYADPSTTIYQLADGGEQPATFRLEGDRLVPLDAQQIPVPSPPGMDNTFHKVTAPLKHGKMCVPCGHSRRVFS